MVQQSPTGDLQSQYDYWNKQADRWANSFHFWDDLGSLGAAQENRLQDRAQQKAADALNLLGAQEQRNFEERMDNTKYQRAVKDLNAAGFSPLTLLANAPSSAPSGSAASYSSGSKVRSKEKSGLGDLASLAIRVLGLLALKH